MVTIGGLDDAEGDTVCAAGAGGDPPGVVGAPMLAEGAPGGVAGAPGGVGVVGAAGVPWVVGLDGPGAATVTAPPVNPARYPEMPDATL